MKPVSLLTGVLTAGHVTSPCPAQQHPAAWGERKRRCFLSHSADPQSLRGSSGVPRCEVSGCGWDCRAPGAALPAVTDARELILARAEIPLGYSQGCKSRLVRAAAPSRPAAPLARGSAAALLGAAGAPGFGANLRLSSSAERPRFSAAGTGSAEVLLLQSKHI